MNTVHCSLFTEQRCKQAARYVSDAFARVVSVDASVKLPVFRRGRSEDAPTRERVVERGGPQKE